MSKSSGGVPPGTTHFNDEIFFFTSHCYSSEQPGKTASGTNQTLQICIK